MPSSVSGRWVAGPSATTQNRVVSPRVSRVFINTLMPAEPEKLDLGQVDDQAFRLLGERGIDGLGQSGGREHVNTSADRHHCQPVDL